MQLDILINYGYVTAVSTSRTEGKNRVTPVSIVSVGQPATVEEVSRHKGDGHQLYGTADAETGEALGRRPFPATTAEVSRSWPTLLATTGPTAPSFPSMSPTTR